MKRFLSIFIDHFTNSFKLLIAYIIFVILGAGLLYLPISLHQFDNGAQTLKYMVRFHKSKDPKNSYFVKIKPSLISVPLDLNVDQFENGTKN